MQRRILNFRDSGGHLAAEDFGVEGPNKRDLDSVVSDRPVILLERWGHGCWMNSKALEAMGASSDTADAVPGLAYYQRDGANPPAGLKRVSLGTHFLKRHAHRKV